MKKVLILFGLVFLAACGGGTAPGAYTGDSPRQIAEAIIAEQEHIAPMNYLVPEGEFFWGYVRDRYQIDTDMIEDGIIFYAGGVIVDEVAVLVLRDGADAAVVRDALTAYAARRRVAFAGYAPEQAGILSNAVVSVTGRHVALLVTEEPREAEASFFARFEDEPPAVVPVAAIAVEEAEEDIIEEEYVVTETEEEYFEEEYYEEKYYEYEEEIIINDAYDRRAIVRAWHSGDPSELTPMNRRIFDKCAEVIAEVIQPGMSDFDRQLAVINWIIMWSVYDPEFLSNSPTAAPDPNNDNPYGVLFSRVGNCFGFTFTFQLFMELLGIESMVVHGYDFTGGRHAWNLVNIYGNWYAVDVTLDVTLNNPLGVDITHQPEEIEHRHLNVTSEHLWNVLGHYWDWFSVPIAE